MTQISHIIHKDENGRETVLYCPGMGNGTDDYMICEDHTEADLALGYEAANDDEDEIILHGVKHYRTSEGWGIPEGCGPCSQIYWSGETLFPLEMEELRGVFEVTLEWEESWWSVVEAVPISEVAAKLILEQQERINKLESRCRALAQELRR